MVPILNEKRSATHALQGTHSPHTKYVIDQSTHISRNLARFCSVIPIANHSLCMIQPVTTYYSHIPLNAYRICDIYTSIFLCVIAKLSMKEPTATCTYK